MWCLAAMAVWESGLSSSWPNTHLQPFECSVPFLEAPFVSLQLLGATLALALDGDGWVVAAPCFSAPATQEKDWAPCEELYVHIYYIMLLTKYHKFPCIFQLKNAR